MSVSELVAAATQAVNNLRPFAVIANPTASPTVQGPRDFQQAMAAITTALAAVAQGGGGLETLVNIGSGAQVLQNVIGTEGRFRTLVAGANVTVAQGPQTIEISAAAPPIESLANVGAGVGVLQGVVGSQGRFRTLVAGQNVTLSVVGDTVEIAAPPEPAVVELVADVAGDVAVDLALGSTFHLALDGNYTLLNPTNLVAPVTVSIIVTQVGGGNTLAYGSAYLFAGGVAPTITATDGATDLISALGTPPAAIPPSSLICAILQDVQSTTP